MLTTLETRRQLAQQHEALALSMIATWNTHRVVDKILPSDIGNFLHFSSATGREFSMMPNPDQNDVGRRILESLRTKRLI